ncbi:hypothetical protein POM88_025324 [Heracleum sosnowskyi]|uniref:Uncharacterized protein n=1 Tax=Heracleum sosnowskyi TaxID=360622 RepID=A0AAD8I6T4_9APIA|nr:hypothetical protein POM88_025324 [Heracleum sosnowskyi]
MSELMGTGMCVWFGNAGHCFCPKFENKYKVDGFLWRGEGGQSADQVVQRRGRGVMKWCPVCFFCVLTIVIDWFGDFGVFEEAAGLGSVVVVTAGSTQQRGGTVNGTFHVGTGYPLPYSSGGIRLRGTWMPTSRHPNSLDFQVKNQFVYSIWGFILGFTRYSLSPLLLVSMMMMRSQASMTVSLLSNIEAKEGGIDAVISEDNDLLAYGYPFVESSLITEPLWDTSILLSGLYELRADLSIFKNHIRAEYASLAAKMVQVTK